MAEHLLSHQGVREVVEPADGGPVVADHRLVGADRGGREHDREGGPAQGGRRGPGLPGGLARHLRGRDLVRHPAGAAENGRQHQQQEDRRVQPAGRRTRAQRRDQGGHKGHAQQGQCARVPDRVRGGQDGLSRPGCGAPPEQGQGPGTEDEEHGRERDPQRDPRPGEAGQDQRHDRDSRQGQGTGVAEPLSQAAGRPQQGGPEVTGQHDPSGRRTKRAEEVQEHQAPARGTAARTTAPWQTLAANVLEPKLPEFTEASGLAARDLAFPRRLARAGPQAS